MPQGPSSDGNRLYLFVNIVDDSDGTTVYNIPTPVVVTANDNLADSLAQSITSNDPNCPFLIDLNSGNLNLVSKNVIALTSVFNIQSSSSNSSNSTSTMLENNQKSELREFMINKVNDLSISDISSIKVISSALSAATGTPQQINSKSAVT